MVSREIVTNIIKLTKIGNVPFLLKLYIIIVTYMYKNWQ